MEKYRQFADGGTGVNPFVPLWSHHKSSLGIKAVKMVFLLPLAMLRLALFVVALVWLAFAEGLCMFIPLGFIRYPVYRALTYFGCCLALIALGLVPSGDSLADHRRLKILPPKSGGAQVFDAKRGTLVLVNQQGLTDVLYLSMKLSPTFVFPAGNGAPVRHSLLSALRRASARRPPPQVLKPSTLTDIAAAARSGWQGPVVVFAEGACTNGSCVLAWKPKTFEGMESFEKPVGTALASLQYSKTGAYTPHHTVGTAFRHVFWMCFQPWHAVRSVWLPAADAAAAVKGKPLQEQTALLRTVLTRMITGAVEVEVTADKHLDFMAYWDASQRKRYTQQQKKTS